MQQHVIITAALVIDIMGLGALLYWLPATNRKDLFFAVTVDPSYTDTLPARSLERGYRRSVLVQSVLWLLIALGAAAIGATLPTARASALVMGLFPVALLGLLAGSITAFFRRRMQVLPHSGQPSSRREASLGRSTRPADRGVAWLVAGPFIMIAMTALVCFGIWDRIPDRFPSHWGFDGDVDGWTTRSPLGVGFPLLLALPINLLFMTLALRVPFQSRRLFASGPAAEHEMAARRIGSRLLAGVCYFLTLPLCIATLYLPLAGNSKTLPMLLMLVVIVSDLILLCMAVVAVTRASAHMEKARLVAVEAGAGIIGDRTEDRYWIWGAFYNNPDDASVWVDKRFGYGWTVNLGNWQGRAWLAGLLIIPLALIVCLNL